MGVYFISLIVASILLRLEHCHGRKFSFRFPRRRRQVKEYDTQPSVSPAVATEPPEKEVVDGDAPTLKEIREVLDQFAETADQVTGELRDVIPTFGAKMWEHFLQIITHKPPVGIVSVLVVSHLIISRRIFRIHKSRQTIDDVLDDSQPQRYTKRPWQLEQTDREYPQHGGVDHTRQRLLHASLAYILENKADSLDSSTVDLVHSLAQGLSVKDINSKVRMLQEMITPLSQIPNIPARKLSADDLTGSIITTSAITLEKRFMDALLRVARNRLLQTCYRLARTREYWERKVENGNRSYFFRRITSDKDRLRLEYARSAERAEVARLGKIVSLLHERPADWPDKYLLQTLKASDDLKAELKAVQKSQAPWQPVLENPGDFGAWRTTLSLPSLKKYSIWWNPGTGLQLRRTDLSNLDGEAAMHVALEAIGHETDSQASINWCRKCRKALSQVVHEALLASSGTNATVSNSPRTVDGFQAIKNTWIEENTEKATRAVVAYVNALASWRRVGEAKTVRFKDLGVVRFFRRFNIFGIPGALGWVVAASKTNSFLCPYLPSISKEVHTMIATIIEISHARILVPLKGIYDDIMEKNPGIFSAFGLEVERTSLDHMLRDMGFGDGTAETRQFALQKAATHYEETLKSGVLKNVIQGRLARQLLVQVQQLKVGLLTALDTIDVLLKGNRIHFQLLAAIPAVLVITYGFRLFIRLLYNLRSKDVRPLFAVHGEMSNYLDAIEYRVAKSNLRGNGNGLSYDEVGEIVLLIHRYLILLDFGSPPIPPRCRDRIHEALQLVVDRSSADWLAIVRTKHEEIEKYL